MTDGLVVGIVSLVRLSLSQQPSVLQKAKANAKGKPKANPKVKAAVKSSPHPKGKAQAKPKSKRANTERTKTYNRIYSKVYRQVRSAGEAWRKPKGWVVMLRLSTFLREELDCQLLMEF